MTVFEVIAYIFDRIIFALKEFNLLYGVTGWQLIMFSIVATDVSLIIKYGLIGSKKEVGSDN
jgi:hypothetical protein